MSYTARCTFINKAGITSSTFKTVPDVPVETFELYLPQGGDSALAANGNLCKLRGKLKMPTEFVAQNDLVIHQNVKIALGCLSWRLEDDIHVYGARSRNVVASRHGVNRLEETRTEKGFRSPSAFVRSRSVDAPRGGDSRCGV